MSANQVGGDGTNNRNCTRCEHTDSYDDMVQCDACNQWVHYECAGVNESIGDPERSFRCPTCLAPDGAVGDPMQEESASEVVCDRGSVGRSSRSSKRSDQRSIKLRLSLLEEQRELMRKKYEEEERLLREKYVLLEQQCETESTNSRKSGVSAKERQQRTKNWAAKQVATVSTPSLAQTIVPRIVAEGHSGVQRQTMASSMLLPPHGNVNDLRRSFENLSTLAAARATGEHEVGVMQSIAGPSKVFVSTSHVAGVKPTAQWQSTSEARAMYAIGKSSERATRAINSESASLGLKNAFLPVARSVAGSSRPKVNVPEMAMSRAKCEWTDSGTISSSPSHASRIAKFRRGSTRLATLY